VVHIEDDGKIIDVQKGGSVTFVLASHAGTGYVWAPTKVDPAFLTQVGDRSSDVPNDIPGAKKYDVYHFTVGAAASGSSVVEMSLKRPFGNERIARAIHVTVNAH
jgi:predicted secreted protein